ncbi:sensor histidine kinase [Cohnella cellulosilytica]|uniref:Histidine kinase n=1 Tax=Cohnella cellulosilytica TaxID=986710 RepID=A0ABW2FK00_9BACL
MENRDERMTKWRRWRNALRFRRIRSRFLASMLVLFLPSIILLGTISYNITKRTIVEMNEQTTRDHLRTSSEVEDLLFRNVINLHFSIVVNDAIQDNLRSRGHPNVSYDARDDGLAAQLQRVLNKGLTDTRYVKSICLLDLQYRTSCVGRSDDAGVHRGSDTAANIAAADWYREAYANNGKVVFYRSDVFGEARDVFSTVKLFRDADEVGGEPLGLLVVNVSKTIFDKVFTDSGERGSYLAVDSAPDATTAVYSGSDTVELKNGTIAETLKDLRKHGYQVSSHYNQMTNWTFLHVVETKVLLRESDNIRWATTAIAAGVSVIALIYSYFISGSITRPLLQLKKMMLDWMKGSRQFPDAFAKDEVGVIGETFRRIAYENEELNERLFHSELKEREAELRTLQSQIKPHFLYNTLDSIYWMATLQNNGNVAQMAVSLSESFKLSLNKGKELISVYKELQHIHHYMKIQNIRFDNRFRYVEQVDESIMSVEVLKLLLQPLVENAIYHGLEPKIGSGEVRLTGVKEDAYLVFTVEDDGVGMDDPERTEQGYGLRNVKERLKLYYGQDSGLYVWSRPGEGTRITLRFQPYADLKKPDIDHKNEALT